MQSSLSKKRKQQPSMQLLSRLPDDVFLQLQSRLPDDIFHEILQRLPVKSLLRFTSVSKSWNSYIKNPSFISSHHRYHHDKTSRCFDLVFMQHPCLDSVHTCSLIPESSTAITLTPISDCYPILTPVPYSKPILAPVPNCNPILKLRGEFIGSSEGLICFKRTSTLYVWNPFIRPSLKIPVNTGPNRSIQLGFGFAPKSCDHRVVKLIFNDKCKCNYFTEVEIYSLASSSWRRIKPPMTRVTCIDEAFSTTGVYLDGSVYWMAQLWGKDGDDPELILRFDLEEERFEEIASPPICEYPSSLGYSLGVIKGFLVLWKVLMVKTNTINVRAYINRKSNWGAHSVELILNTVEGEEMLGFGTTKSGQIIARYERNRIMVIHTYCDGERLSFKSRYLDLDAIGLQTDRFLALPITKTLFLLDKK